MKKENMSLEGLVRQLFVSVVWSHKIQCKQADIYKNRSNILNIISIVVSALTTAGIFTVIFSDTVWLKIISSIFSFIVTSISAFLKTFDLTTLEKNHMKTANELWDIRERLLILLIEIGVDKKNYEELMCSYQQIQQDLKIIYENSPTTLDKAVVLAKKALKIEKDYTYTDDEIDKFLPSCCRKTTTEGLI